MEKGSYTYIPNLDRTYVRKFFSAYECPDPVFVLAPYSYSRGRTRSKKNKGLRITLDLA